MIALVADQWIGLGLLVAVLGYAAVDLIVDLLRAMVVALVAVAFALGLSAWIKASGDRNRPSTGDRVRAPLIDPLDVWAAELELELREQRLRILNENSVRGAAARLSATMREFSRVLAGDQPAAEDAGKLTREQRTSASP